MLLNLHSHYSLRYGTLSIKELITHLLAGGYDTVVLTDINNSSATLDFIKACKLHGLNGLAGMEYRNKDELLYIGIAKNTEGFRELNELATSANRTKSALPEKAPDFNHVFVVYPFGKISPECLRENEYIGIRENQLNKIILSPRQEWEKYVLLYSVSFERGKHTLHQQLRAIDHNLLISQLQAGQYATENEYMISREELLKKFKNFPLLIANTEKLLRQCSFDFDFTLVRNKQSFTGDCYEDKNLLLKYTMEGFYRRYKANDEVAKARIRKELDIIEKLKFSAYFLITDDICRYARHRGFHYVGRGSGANSIVAYCLGITDVDPIDLNLYFERFLNPKRKVPPDLDVDFSWANRDEVYDYIFDCYDTDCTALMGAMSTFRSRSMKRELGKIYGLPKGEIDRLIREPGHLLNKNEVTEMILSVCEDIPKDFPNQRTVHASGVLISEFPITNYCALDYPPKGYPTAQINMYTAENINFEKFDILSQRGIGHIKDCCKLVAQNKKETIHTDCPQRFFKDKKLAAQLKSAHTIGCFYIESPAMRQLLAKLKCDNYLTLVAASSIIRPGVAFSGMMKAYIERHHDSSKVHYPHPVFKEQLKETYGIMVYQEDVMKIGHYYGGLDLADADVLRRMMSAKRISEERMKVIKDKFFSHCKQMNYPEATSREIWRQMESFAGYSFNKAHSASFAVESYQSLYLKTYYPLEFMVAVLNNYGGFYPRSVYINEAKRSGGNICLPCVNKSEYQATIEGKNIYLGFDCLLHLENDLAQRISKERKRNGTYSSIENFIHRTGAGLEQIVVLIRCGAFRFTGIGKKELLWEAHLLLSKVKRQTSDLLFESDHVRPVLPRLETSLLEDIYDELELFGFPVSASMFDLVKSNYRGTAMAEDLVNMEGQSVRLVVDWVCEKRVTTQNGLQMKFGTFLDERGAFIDTVHFPKQLKEYPLNGRGVYLIQGKVVLDFGVPSVEVEKCAKMAFQPDPRSI